MKKVEINSTCWEFKKSVGIVDITSANTLTPNSLFAGEVFVIRNSRFLISSTIGRLPDTIAEKDDY